MLVWHVTNNVSENPFLKCGNSHGYHVYLDDVCQTRLYRNILGYYLT